MEEIKLNISPAELVKTENNKLLKQESLRFLKSVQKSVVERIKNKQKELDSLYKQQIIVIELIEREK